MPSTYSTNWKRLAGSQRDKSYNFSFPPKIGMAFSKAKEKKDPSILGENLYRLGVQFKAYVTLLASTYKLLLPVYGVAVLASTDDIQMTLVLFKQDSCTRARQHSNASAKEARYNKMTSQ